MRVQLLPLAPFAVSHHEGKEDLPLVHQLCGELGGDGAGDVTEVEDAELLDKVEICAELAVADPSEWANGDLELGERERIGEGNDVSLYLRSHKRDLL